VNSFAALFRSTLWWVVPLAALLLAIGWEIDWGAAVRKPLPPDEPLAPKPLATELLPNYTIEGGLAANAETVNRTLFNPTRRPAPVALAESAKPRMQKGLYTLTGTTIAGERSLAFLKEVKGGKARTVRQGDTIDGMLVAEVTPDRVRLALADESEDLRLRVVTNPKPTPQPPPPPPPPAPAAGAAPAPAGAAPLTQPGTPPAPAPPTRSPTATPQPAPAAQSLAERRRAARAAEMAARGAETANNPSATPSATPAAPDGTWEAMDQRYRRGAQGSGR
jgi:hypothetical protein